MVLILGFVPGGHLSGPHSGMCSKMQSERIAYWDMFQAI